MVNRAPWAHCRQENYMLPKASCWVLPIDHSFIKTQAPFEPCINKRLAIKCNSFKSTQVHGDEIASQRWKRPGFTVNIIRYLNLEMKQGWGKESGFRSELPCSQRWALLPRLTRVLLPARARRKPLTFFGSLCNMFQTGWGKASFAQTRLTHRCYSPATCLGERRSSSPILHSDPRNSRKSP